MILVYESGDNFFHHLQVGGGKYLLQLQPIADSVVFIPHVWVGEIPVIVGVQIVVEAMVR